MLTISKPLSAAQVQTYHAEEFSNAQGNYYTEGDRVPGQWHGQLARTWELPADVRQEHLARLAEGEHPLTGARLVQSQTAHTYRDAHDRAVTTMAHRAAWDATFSAPKSVSLTALVGGDERVRAAHQESVTVALDELERYVQARIGRTHPAETTGQWIAARYEHDSARPVDGYAAPQLHTHVVIFNVTVRENGEPRALQPRELFKSQAYAKAVYQSELARRVIRLGYGVERGPSGEPEIRGYSQAYLDASSPRRQQIQDHLAKVQQRGAAAAEIAAHQTRDAKLETSPEAMQAQHQALAAAYGDQPAQVVAAARDQAQRQAAASPAITAHEAVTFAKVRNIEREAVVDERDVLRDALRRSLGELTLDTLKADLAERVSAGEFIAVASPPGAPGRAFTTREMIDLERDLLQRMRAGQQTQPALVVGITVDDLTHRYPHLHEGQRSAVQQILASRDQVQALEGVAGGGKTTALAAVRDAAERAGYTVDGVAPTSRAAQQLAEAGVRAGTLQRHLARGASPDDGSPRLYVLDESSLASTIQMHTFLERLHARDRVLLVGDIRQHQAVEAGRPYQQLQETGIAIARLDEIVRQRDPGLKAVVEQLAHGAIREAVQHLDRQGRVHAIADRHERLTAIAHAYVQAPAGTLVVSPDHHSRSEINQRIHRVLQNAAQVDRQDHRVRVLVARQDLTGADRQWAPQYVSGEVIRYSRGSQVIGVRAGEYTQVDHVQARANRLTVTRATGESLTYDPRRLQGVTVYREAERALAVGDRVQFTAPYQARQVANRELGTIEAINAEGHLRVRLDAGRRVSFDVHAYPHLDYGYAVTSHSSQGLTADRVLVHVDTEHLGEQLVNRRLAYVAVSRGLYDAQIFTNDKTQLGEVLSRDVSHQSALEATQETAAPAQRREPSGVPAKTVHLGIG